MGFAGRQACGEVVGTYRGLVLHGIYSRWQSGSYDKTVKYWDVTLLGNRQVSMGTIVNKEQGFPLVRSFLGHRVRSLLLLSGNGG